MIQRYHNDINVLAMIFKIRYVYLDCICLSGSTIGSGPCWVMHVMNWI